MVNWFSSLLWGKDFPKFYAALKSKGEMFPIINIKDQLILLFSYITIKAISFFRRVQNGIKSTFPEALSREIQILHCAMPPCKRVFTQYVTYVEFLVILATGGTT